MLLKYSEYLKGNKRYVGQTQNEENRYKWKSYFMLWELKIYQEYKSHKYLLTSIHNFEILKVKPAWNPRRILQIKSIWERFYYTYFNLQIKNNKGNDWKYKKTWIINLHIDVCLLKMNNTYSFKHDYRHKNSINTISQGNINFAVLNKKIHILYTTTK